MTVHFILNGAASTFPLCSLALFDEFIDLIAGERFYASKEQ